jgi:hypothetical protein
MSSQDVYHHWRQSHTYVATSPDFNRRVMDRIARRAERDAVPQSERIALVERMSVWLWARAAAIAVAALIGITRILLTLHVLLLG